MLNFSVGAKNMLLMCKTAEVKMVITSLTFIKMAKMEEFVETLEQAGVKVSL